MTAHGDIAIQLVYLIAGIETKLRTYRVTQRLTGCDDHFLLEQGGHIGMVTDLVPYAAEVAAWAAEQAGQDFPGIFEYEVTEVLGNWVAGVANAEGFTADLFTAKLNELGSKFFAQSETFNQEKPCASI